VVSKVIKPSEFNINKINIINDVKNLKNGMKVLNIHYDGNCEVLIQTPEITLPFDADCLDGPFLAEYHWGADKPTKDATIGQPKKKSRAKTPPLSVKHGVFKVAFD
jgi:hypothetical protein